MEEIVYLNGELVPRAGASLSVNDHGFLYGYGLYETMRAYHGKIFLLERHIKRLLDSAETIGLGSKLSQDELILACDKTLRENNLEDARVRVTVTGGDGDIFPWSAKDLKPTVLVTARSAMAYSEEKSREGYKAILSSIRRSKGSSLTRIKSVNYLESTLARREAAERGLDEALLLNEDGYLAEGGGCNIFFVRSSKLVTPTLGSGVLPGITREVVIELAEKLGITVSEGTVGLAIIRQCEEAFLTNSVIEVMPLVEVRDMLDHSVAIGKGKPGEITGRLMAAYRELVEKETSP